jgi:hypothetical protein
MPTQPGASHVFRLTTSAIANSAAWAPNSHIVNAQMSLRATPRFPTVG